MSSGKKVLRSSENVSKTGGNENNGAQKSTKYGAAYPYQHPHGPHRHPPHLYYHNRYSSLRTPPRLLPFSQPPPDQQLNSLRDYSSQQNPPLPQQQPAPLKEETQQKQPLPPRSAFMCFKDNKKREIVAKRSNKESGKQILQIVSQEWRALSDKERAYWEEQAREDKLRFVREKNDFKGTWNIPKKRAKKHPGAPKRPMSAFLKFSKDVRPRVKKENPAMANTDVSCLLGEMWRNASPAEKASYVQSELEERAAYKEEIQKFREKQASLDAAARITHQSAVHGHQMYQQQEQKTTAKTYPSFERANRSSPSNITFEHFNIETLNDEPSSKQSAFRLHPSQQYHRPSYHPSEYYFPESYPQVTWSALSIDEADPLPVMPLRGQPQYQPASQGSSDDFHTSSAFYSARGNSQYPDPFDLPRFPRYP